MCAAATAALVGLGAAGCSSARRADSALEQSTDDITQEAPEGSEVPEGSEAPEAAELPPTSTSDPASTASPEQGPEAPTTDSLLRLNQIQLFGTHNSYHVEGPAALAVADWRYTHAPIAEQLDVQGVRKLELDLHFNDGEIEVKHVPVLDEGTHCELLGDCLAEVRAWSDAHPGHHTLFVQIEPKDDLTPVDDYEAFYDAIEATIVEHWPLERIVTPDRVQGDAPTLREAVISGEGWPKLGESRGHILFFVNNSGAFRDGYSANNTDLSGRLMFVEAEADEPVAAVQVFNSPDVETIRRAVEQGFIVRTRADGVPLPDDAEQRAERARQSGAQIISTDFPALEEDGYVFELTGGNPSRCNPVNAPPECEASWVEDLP